MNAIRSDWVAENIASGAELAQFFAAWRDMMCAIDHVRIKHRSNVIQNPKLPSVISEAVAARIYVYMHPAKFGHIQRGGGADLIAITDNQEIRIEVKGSGTAEFQTIGPKDRACGLLMWIRFGDVTALSVDSKISFTTFDPRFCQTTLEGTRLSYSNLRANSSAVVSEGSVGLRDIMEII